jgi:uncharacterized RDD family membrane protein YckC
MEKALSFLKNTPYFKFLIGSFVVSFLAVAAIAITKTTFQWSEPQPYYHPDLIAQCQYIESICRPNLRPEGMTSDEIVCTWSKERELGISCPTFSDKTWAGIFRYNFQLGNLFAAALIFGTLLSASIFSAKYISSQNHSGWQRISIVTGAIGSAAALYAFRDEFNGEELFFRWYLWSLALFLAPITIRSIYLWVNGGFNSPNAVRTLKTLSTPEPAVIITDSNNPGLPVTWTEAGFWNRFFARCLDVAAVYLITNLITVFIPDIPGSGNWYLGTTLLNMVITYAILCAVLYFYDVYFLTKHGATLGKMALGLKIQSKEGKSSLSKEDAKARTLKFMSEGIFYMFFFPLVQIIGAVLAWRRRKSTQPWDAACGSTVLQRSINPFRVIFFKMLGIFLIFSLLIAIQVMKQIEKDQLRNSIHQSYTR